MALLGLALLVVLGPLIWAPRDYFPAVAPGARASDLRPPRRRRLAARDLDRSSPHRAAGHRLGLVDIVPGVVVSFVSSIVFGEIFGLYLSQFVRNYVSTYAGLASVMIALAYLYSLALHLRLRRRAQRGDHQGAAGRAGKLKDARYQAP